MMSWMDLMVAELRAMGESFQWSVFSVQETAGLEEASALSRPQLL